MLYVRYRESERVYVGVYKIVWICERKRVSLVAYLGSVCVCERNVVVDVFKWYMLEWQCCHILVWIVECEIIS